MKKMFSLAPASALLTLSLFVQEAPPQNTFDPLSELAPWNIHTNVATANDSNLTILGHWGWGPCFTVQVRDNYAFIGNGTLFQVLDVSNPASPKIVGEVNTQGVVSNIVLAGNYAYINHPLQIIDISEPTSPKIVPVDIDIGGEKLILQGNYLYVQDTNAIHIVDVSNPVDPKELSSIPSRGGLTTDFTVTDSFLYETDGWVLGGGPNIHIHDVSDKNSPIFVGDYNIGAPGGAITIAGHYLYIGDVFQNGGGPHRKFIILDINSPTAPKFTGELIKPGFQASSITIRDSLAYITLEGQGLSIVNIADKTKPIEIARVAPDVSGVAANNLSILSSYAYIAAINGLWIVNLDSLVTASYLPTGGLAFQLAAQFPYVFMYFRNLGLMTINAGEPPSPKLVGSHLIGTYAEDISVWEDRAYLLSTNDLLILDISPPEMPIELGRITLQDTLSVTSLKIIAVSDSIVVVGHQAPKFSIIDVSDPKQPRLLGDFPASGQFGALEISGSYLYSAESHSGLHVYRLSQPLIPPLEVVSFSDMYASGLHVIGNHLLVATDSGLTVFDIAKPSQPVEFGRLPIPIGRTKVKMASTGKFLYMNYLNPESYYEGDLDMFDVSDPEHPKIIGYKRRVGFLDVEAFENLVFVPANTAGFLILQNDLLTSVHEPEVSKGATQFKLHQNYPNPFNPETTIRYELATRTNVRLCVYNALGQLVEILLERVQDKGNYEIVFSGAHLSSGTYYLALETNEGHQVKGAILVK